MTIILISILVAGHQMLSSLVAGRCRSRLAGPRWSSSPSPRGRRREGSPRRPRRRREVSLRRPFPPDLASPRAAERDGRETGEHGGEANFQTEK